MRMERESILYQFHNPETTKSTLAFPLRDVEMNGLEINKYRKKSFRALGRMMILSYSEKSQYDSNLHDEIKIFKNIFMIIYYMRTY